MRQLLPSDEDLDQMSREVSKNNRDEDLEDCLYVLEGATDDERCERYIERNATVPYFLFAFLLRPFSKITSSSTLHTVIRLSDRFFWDETKSRPRRGQPEVPGDLKTSLVLRRDRFSSIAALLRLHCVRVEPRLIVKLAILASQTLEKVKLHPDIPKKLYCLQCDIFNKVLVMLQPLSGARPIDQPCPNAYFWEAQRIMLATSARLEKPLLLNRNSFRAVRHVLAGQAKNMTEMHNAKRQMESWPPYLQSGEGMDENADTDDSWSRTVNAGILMQEAGFAKEEQDDALDILQGMAIDGSPTIQQRISVPKDRFIGPWEASIRATRNAQEAWERFLDPPKPGMKPGLSQYSAMFEKLVLRDAEPNSSALPGDAALNFVTSRYANLTDFEKARLRPPSVAQLYQKMRMSGIKPKGTCLQILVANAQSLQIAHEYLRDSTESEGAMSGLVAKEPKVPDLKHVPMSLFVAYIQACTKVDGRSGDRPLKRAMHMATLRLDSTCLRWAPVVWGLILKALSQHHSALKITRSMQLDLILRTVSFIEEGGGISASTFTQFVKSTRKVIRRELPELLADLETPNLSKTNPWWHLYEPSWKGPTISQNENKGPGKEEEKDGPEVTSAPISMVKVATGRAKAMFNTLVAKEGETQGLLGLHQVAPLDRMACRTDPVVSGHAHDYLLTLGFMGEFEEMAKTLRWLVREWAREDVVNAMNELYEPPAHSQFFETLCVFRLLAEPVLDDTIVESLREEVASATSAWTWPDDEAVKAYAEVQHEEGVDNLRRVLDWTRHRRHIRSAGLSAQSEVGKKTGFFKRPHLFMKSA